MSFLVAAALGVAALLIVPTVAHLLRRGRAREVKFPPAGLVPPARSTARQQRRLEDRLLLAIRVLAVVVLSILGATPLVQCSRVSLARNSGASVALALVVDDSLSMRAELGEGTTRFDRALEAAGQLLSSARSGDAVAIVLAGQPARIALATTSDLGAARRALGELAVSDRSTDLASAVTLARATLAEQPHGDKRIVVLSDLAGEPLPEGTPAAWVPVPELASGVHDCAVTSAERRGRNVSVAVACTTPEAANGRNVVAVSLAGSGVEPSSERRRARIKQEPSKPLGQAPLAPRAGLQMVTIDVESKAELAVSLSGKDSLAHDDLAAVSEESSALGVAIAADPTRASAKTGGPTLLEQAVRALEAGVDVRPLSVIPERAAELSEVSLLLLDDPPGLAPEVRAALVEFVEGGGVVVALIGPNADTVQLGSTLEPFVSGAVRWQTDELAAGVDPASLGWLGPEAGSLTELRPRGRARLDAGELRDSTVIARWTDQKPWLLERKLARGVLYSLAVPSSVDQSDLALRPGFLALLDYFLEQAARRSGPRRSVAGSEWSVPGANPSVTGPEGPVDLREASEEKLAIPRIRGLYSVVHDGASQARVVVLDPNEVLAAPRAAPKSALQSAGENRGAVDASREAALVLVALLALELLVRLLRSRGTRRASPAPV